MPIYEYRRPDGSTFELIQRFADEALTSDPETGEPVQRVLHSPALHFKGKGFYNTDYGTRKRERELAKSADDGSAKTEAKQADKKDAKGGSSSTSTETSSSGSSSTAGSSAGSGSTSTQAKKAS